MMQVFPLVCPTSVHIHLWVKNLGTDKIENFVLKWYETLLQNSIKKLMGARCGRKLAANILPAPILKYQCRDSNVTFDQENIVCRIFISRNRRRSSCMQIHACILVYISIHISVCACISYIHTHKCISIHTYVSLCVCVCLHFYVYICVYVCMLRINMSMFYAYLHVIPFIIAF